MYTNSNRHKLELSSWLLKNQSEEFSSSLKLQKFIFFYEAFTKLENQEADFGYLRAYINGPVFSDVFGDYTYRKEFLTSSISEINSYESLNLDRAKMAGFIVKILNEEELSKLTHEFNIWKVQEPLIGRISNISMREEDFSLEDFQLLKSLQEMYPVEMYDEVEVLPIGDKNFVISKEDIEKLSEEQRNVFINLAEQDLHNPVFVTMSEDGVLLID